MLLAKLPAKQLGLASYSVIQTLKPANWRRGQAPAWNHENGIIRHFGVSLKQDRNRFLTIMQRKQFA
jgi:hypothetical protein